jgi:CDP-2,3-bis-(O-geranylgeranyl)-sn-glycerol synthase
MGRLAELIYFMVPAYLANMAPPFVRFWRGWNHPINRRWLGDHKTVVGFGAGLIVALAATFLQSRIYGPSRLWPADDWPIIGIAFGLGAMGGDCFKSFLKRLRGIPPGRPWIPMDQLDFVLGALIVTLPWVHLPWSDIATILIASFLGDLVINQLAFWMGIRSTPW